MSRYRVTPRTQAQDSNQQTAEGHSPASRAAQSPCQPAARASNRKSAVYGSVLLHVLKSVTCLSVSVRVERKEWSRLRSKGRDSIGKSVWYLRTGAAGLSWCTLSGNPVELPNTPPDPTPGLIPPVYVFV